MAKQVTDEWVADELARCLVGRPNYPSPDEDAVSWLTRRINQYLARPWDDAGIAELWDQVKAERRENATLREAAGILRRDLAGWRDLLPGYDPGSAMRNAAEQRITALDVTISTLELQRGYFDCPGLTLRVSERGPLPKPWALMAAGIADEVHRVLHDGGDPRKGIGGPNGPVTNFLAACLHLIMPGDVPDNLTINEAVKNHLGPSLEYRS